MKLIIDIDESLLNEAKNGHICLGEFADAVMNGVPYEERPQGDRISREALKDLLNEYNKHFTTFTDIQTQIILDIIDHAPTAYKEDDENDK